MSGRREPKFSARDVSVLTPSAAHIVHDLADKFSDWENAMQAWKIALFGAALGAVSIITMGAVVHHGSGTPKTAAAPVASTSHGLQIVGTDGLIPADHAYRPLTGDGQ